MHSRYHAYADYVSYVGVDRKAVEFLGNKQIHSLAHSQTELYISVGLLQIEYDWRQAASEAAAR